MIRQKQKIGTQTRKESIQSILYAYLFLICTALPLYMKNGYYELGEAKFLFYRNLTLGTITVLLPFIMFQIPRSTKWREEDDLKMPLCLYAFSIILSFVFSVNHQESLWGTDGWRMGFLTELLILLFFILFRYCFLWSTKIVESSLLGALLVFTLGLLNRFGIYPIASLQVDHSFISTLGNINWYCGFLAIFLPVGMGLLVCSSITVAEQIFLSIFCLIGLLTAMTQGGESILLSLAAVYAVLFMEGIRNHNHWRGFLFLIILLGAACEIISILQRMFPGQYTYEQDACFVILVTRHAGMIICAIAVFLLTADMLCSEIGVKWRGKALGNLFLRTLPYILTIVPIGILLMQMSGKLADDFGNGRGLIWRISTLMYHDMSPFHKLVGIGPDAYDSYANSVAAVRLEIQKEFGNSRLTNAHGDLLTILLTGGLAGVLSYIWMIFVSAKIMIQRLMMQGENIRKTLQTALEKDQATSAMQDAALIGLLVLSSYLAGNMVSFGQITSTPYFFIFLGYATMHMQQKSEGQT